MDNPILYIENLEVSYNRWGQTIKALDGVNLSIPSAQWIMLIGHNGSGKSTLLKAISGRIFLYSGRIFINNKPIEQMTVKEISDSIFYVHQDPLLGTAASLTIFENLYVADWNSKGLSRKQLQEKYLALLEPLGLGNKLKQMAKTLSGGERQLLALTIAHLRPAKIFLLDEPLAALDPKNAEKCMELIKSLYNKGKTIVQVTHDLDLAKKYADRIIVMAHGKIISDFKKEEFDIGDLSNLLNRR
ncbi:ABC transporter ATP-binding protein [Thermosulfurimonas dismutans]|uniref:Methionine ABC transporter ATP-binding protein n=1 Tax=Thermosulfurimonas dismutans TaxID=999894 RepID=A0A179D3K7_9BACT|nr:ABC transporter ATP-binding protein [Thermosulfurimonas dismutans]OAQ20626.1 Methionine ABC transporter ATP-binding protein [Thermosulfurimonas dismutans]